MTAGLTSKVIVVIIITTIIVAVILSLITGLFFPVLLLNQRRSHLLRFLVFYCSTFRIMYDVPSIGAFLLNLLDVFLVWLPNCPLKLLFLFQWLLLPPVWSYTSCSTFGVSPQIKSSILLSFLLPFAWHFYPLVLPHQYVCFVFFNYCTWSICRNFSICVQPFMS